MAKKVEQVTGDLSTQVSAMGARLNELEKQVQALASQRVKVRKAREYTVEQRAAIRARLLAGQ